MAVNVVLIDPEIPQNTGNIARTCAATGATLHLIGTLGFSIDERAVRRAGLDYWDKVQLQRHSDLGALFREEHAHRWFFTSARGMHRYDRVKYPDDCYLVFGRESTGLPQELLERYREQTVFLPMRKHIRSLNLSNSVAIVVYEAYRQWGFSEIE